MAKTAEKIIARLDSWAKQNLPNMRNSTTSVPEVRGRYYNIVLG